jgi:hypothetical protein
MKEYHLLYLQEDETTSLEPLDDQEPLECDSCGQPVPVAAFWRGYGGKRTDSKYLCELCASSLAGNTVDHPAQYPDAVVMQTVAAVGNLVLQRLEARFDQLQRAIEALKEER